tara:strand:+ start:15162 stop:15761 length:600 start_codon:yes stop_codon:yes gene_type:complete
MSNVFWLKNPSILLDKDNIDKLWPTDDMEYVEKLNTITRFVLLITTLGYIIMDSYIIIILGIIVLLIIVFFYKNYINNYLENFSVSENNDVDKHTSKNPLYNVLLTDYEDNPKKDEIEDQYTEVKEKNINESVKQFIYDNNKNNKDIKKIFSNLANNLEFENSMRQFHINPSTTIPNNQDDFLSYCYNDLYSEKAVVEY